jgi:hypothetical protein
VGKVFEKINVKVSPQSGGFCRGEVVWAYIGKSKTGAQESIESDHNPATLTPRTQDGVESLREAREFSLFSKAFT